MISFPKNRRFQFGQLLSTPGGIEVLAAGGHDPLEFLRRHATGDWGDLCQDDADANEQAIQSGGRILSSYKTSKGEKLWIITDASDDQGRRGATTILRPEEY